VIILYIYIYVYIYIIRYNYGSGNIYIYIYIDMSPGVFWFTTFYTEGCMGGLQATTAIHFMCSCNFNL